MKINISFYLANIHRWLDLLSKSVLIGFSPQCPGIPDIPWLIVYCSLKTSILGIKLNLLQITPTYVKFFAKHNNTPDPALLFWQDHRVERRLTRPLSDEYKFWKTINYKFVKWVNWLKWSVNCDWQAKSNKEPLK